MVATVFGLTIVGYPIAGLAAILFDVPSRMTSVPFRLVVLALSLAVSVLSVISWCYLAAAKWLTDLTSSIRFWLNGVVSAGLT